MADITRLVDTSILVDYLRGKLTAERWLDNFAPGELGISVVTAVELMAGCENLREQNRLEKDLAAYPVVWVSNAISATAWEWYCQYRLGDGVGFFDCVIAASAHHLGVPVCTLNEKHFRPFPGTKVERPY